MKYAAALAGITIAALAGILLGQSPVAPAAQSGAGTTGAPAATDYYPLASRTIKLPIKYERDRKSIRQVKLYVARNGENTWYQEAAVPPDRDSFTFIAKEDGIYWFTMVEEDLQGRNVPADLTRTPPDLKVIVDTVQPRVQFTSAKRTGEEVVVEWVVEDKNPDETNTKVHFRPAGSDGYWQEVALPAGPKTGVRFSAGTTGGVAVRVTAYDMAGNKSEATREVGGNTANTSGSTSMSPPTPVPPTTPVTPIGGSGAGPGSPIPPPDSLAPPGPVAPITPVTPPGSGGTPAGGTPTGPAPAATPPATGGAGTSGSALPVMSPGTGSGGTGTPAPVQPLPTSDPRTPAAATGGPAPVAVWSGNPASTAPTVEVSRAHTINYLAFDLGYEVESRGPSGISRVDLWVTRDDGRTWLKWSQSDGKGSSVRVNLGVPGNPQPEGTYGFRVVPVSGAGLSEREPAAGDAPDLRVVVDVTAPQLDLFPPVGDPNSADTLVIQWKASDKNFTEDPITIEWGDKPTGPWQPVAPGGDGVQLATASATQVRRVANTGSFAWRVPAGLPPRVYLKVTARDAAGNEKTVVTREPILVDLVKPRAKVSGIVGPAGLPRP
jgi:hypothetical protein